MNPADARDIDLDPPPAFDPETAPPEPARTSGVGRGAQVDEVETTRAEIERTRADMSETVDAIQEKLSPQNIKEQAKDTAKGTGSTIVETIKQNPMPAALTGIGLGWLFMSSCKQGGAGSSSAGRAQQTAIQARSQASGQVQSQASQLGSRTQDQAQRAEGGFQRMLQENPLAVGALAVAAGAAVGLAVPQTSKEHEAMGEARDRAVERAQEKAQETQQKAQRVAEQAQEAAKQEAQEQGFSQQ